jgi:hypothetical protein
VGWYRDGLDGHEGYVALVLADGRESSSTTGSGVVFPGGDNLTHGLTSAQVEADRARGWEVCDRVLGRGDKPAGEADDLSQIYHEVVAPWSAVKTWQGGCECGWRGNRVDAWDVEHPAWTDGAGREYPAHSTRDCPEEIAERLREHWITEHVDRLDGLGRLTRLIVERRHLDVEIDEAAAAAIASGASWAELGRAADMSRQGAITVPARLPGIERRIRRRHASFCRGFVGRFTVAASTVARFTPTEEPVRQPGQIGRVEAPVAVGLAPPVSLSLGHRSRFSQGA